jgi:hypothetical protein
MLKDDFSSRGKHFGGTAVFKISDIHLLSIKQIR